MAEKFVEVYVTYDAVEAEILKDLLESGGVTVVLRSSKVRPYPVNIGKMGEVKMLVPESQRAQALELIEGIE